MQNFLHFLVSVLIIITILTNTAGYSHQKLKSYEIQAKAAENILAAPESIDEKDAEIIEPLAKVRGITVTEMARIIEEKVKKQ